MNNLSSSQLAAEPGVLGGQPLARTTVIALAWMATLLLSNLPLIIARELLGTDIPWMTPIWLGAAALLVAATFVWPALRPLRGYFAIMGVIILASFAVYPALRTSAVWELFAAVQPGMIDLLVQRLVLALLTLGVLLAAVLLGYRRRQLFLTPGDLSAAVQGLRLPGGRPLSWAIFGVVMSLLLAALFSLFILGLLPAGSRLAAAIPWIPVILASAALNAFAEEGMYRAAPLAALLPAVGARHAVWLTALFFGLGHFYGGVPSGVMGLVGPGLLALLLGKAMLDTRGMGWAWIIHVAMDTVIYTAMAIGS